MHQSAASWRPSLFISVRVRVSAQSHSGAICFEFLFKFHFDFSNANSDEDEQESKEKEPESPQKKELAKQCDKCSRKMTAKFDFDKLDKDGDPEAWVVFNCSMCTSREDLDEDLDDEEGDFLTDQFNAILQDITVYYNKKPVQSSQSDKCGLFCMYFVVENIRNPHQFQTFLNTFSTVSRKNDQLVQYLLGRKI